MNPWDKLSERFNTHRSNGDAKAGVGGADNVLIAWPALLAGIETVQPSGAGLTAFDFGCGAGSFCEELHERGYRVVGCDTSQQMIAIARAHVCGKVGLYVAGDEGLAALEEAPFDLVSSIMVLPFIRDIGKTLDHLGLALKEGGLLAIAVFNPDHVRVNTREGGPFVRSADHSRGTDTFLSLGGAEPIPVYVRSERTYAALLKERGYCRIHVQRPRFTRAFLDAHPMRCDTRFSEYMIMVYQKVTGRTASP